MKLKIVNINNNFIYTDYKNYSHISILKNNYQILYLIFIILKFRYMKIL